MTNKQCELAARTLSVLRVPAAILGVLTLCTIIFGMLHFLEHSFGGVGLDYVIWGFVTIACVAICVVFVLVVAELWTDKEAWGPLYDKCRAFWDKK